MAVSQTLVEEKNSRFGQLKWRSRLPLEDTIDEYSILAVAVHVEVRTVVIDLQVSSRNERRVTHVDVDITLRTVPSNDDTALTYHVLELSGFQPRNGSC